MNVKKKRSKENLRYANKHHLQTPLPTVDQSVGAILSSGHLRGNFMQYSLHANPSVPNIQPSYHFVKFLSNYAGRRLTDIIVMGRTKRTKTSSQPAGPKLKQPRRAKKAKRSEVKLSTVERCD